MENRLFIVLVKSNYIRDAQFLSSDDFDFENGNWNDIKGSMLMSWENADSEETALNLTSDIFKINKEKLVAYEVIGNENIILN